jgi:RNA polymerase sigma factor (sigma-70 family)
MLMKLEVCRVESGAQDALYADFQPLVRRLIRQYGRNPEIRKDLEGEIYYQFCRLLAAYDPDRGVPLRPYLVRQLTGSIYTYARQSWRQQQREVSLENFVAEFQPDASHDPTPLWDAMLDFQDVRHTLANALGELSERQRKIVIWRYYEDRTFEEIAAGLGIQVATVRSLLRHGLNRMRRTLCVPSTK